MLLEEEEVVEKKLKQVHYDGSAITTDLNGNYIALVCQ